MDVMMPRIIECIRELRGGWDTLTTPIEIHTTPAVDVLIKTTLLPSCKTEYGCTHPMHIRVMVTMGRQPWVLVTLWDDERAEVHAYGRKLGNLRANTKYGTMSKWLTDPATRYEYWETGDASAVATRLSADKKFRQWLT